MYRLLIKNNVHTYWYVHAYLDSSSPGVVFVYSDTCRSPARTVPRTWSPWDRYHFNSMELQQQARISRWACASCGSCGRSPWHCGHEWMGRYNTMQDAGRAGLWYCNSLPKRRSFSQVRSCQSALTYLSSMQYMQCMQCTRVPGPVKCTRGIPWYSVF